MRGDLSPRTRARSARRVRGDMMMLLLGATALTACRTAIPLPTTASTNLAPARAMVAGVARVDITPPPGAGLMGLGTEGLPAEGHRQRLFARALYLEDARGERLAFVTLDLGESSIVVHRRVAERVRAETGLGSDRLLLSATHTHAGPSHYFGVPAFDEFGSAVRGYDPVLVDSLVARVSRAVLEAYRTRREARAAWGSVPVWGYTRIRSWPAYQRNDTSVRAALRTRMRATDPRLAPREAGVDPTFATLRVDLRDPATGRFLPAGAFSVFAMHATGVPAGQSLYDADLQGRIAALVEQRMGAGGPAWAPRGVYLLAQGGQGDVSPDVDPATRCPTPRLVREGARPGPRGTTFETTWRILPRDAERDARCVPLALRELERVAGGVAREARALYDSLGLRLERDLPIRTAFTVLRATSPSPGAPRTCGPKAGVGTLLGAEDSWTRLRWDWHLLFADSTAYPPLPSTRTPLGFIDCHRYKRNFLGHLQFLVAGPHGLPDHAQLAVARVGPMAIAAIPAEPTSHAAWTMRRAVADALHGAASSADSVLMLSLTNGYLQYVATPAEYALQLYEGAATILGPNELAALTFELRALATRVRESAHWVGDSIALRGHRDDPVSIVRWDERPAAALLGEGWRDYRARIAGDTVHARWTGVAPSAFYDGGGASVFVEAREGGAEWRAVAWDHLPTVELTIERRRGGVAEYRLRWTPAAVPAGARIRLRVGAEWRCRDLVTGAPSAC